MQSHNNTWCIRNSKICKVGSIVCLKIEISMIEPNYNIYFYLEVLFKQRICSNNWKFYVTIEILFRNVIFNLRKKSFMIFQILPIFELSYNW